MSRNAFPTIWQRQQKIADQSESSNFLQNSAEQNQTEPCVLIAELLDQLCDEKVKPQPQIYLKCINNQFITIYNYAVKYYGLNENLYHEVGNTGRRKDEMFRQRQISDTSRAQGRYSSAVFITIYCKGIRESCKSKAHTYNTTQPDTNRQARQILKTAHI